MLEKSGYALWMPPKSSAKHGVSWEYRFFNSFPCTAVYWVLARCFFSCFLCMTTSTLARLQDGIHTPNTQSDLT